MPAKKSKCYGKNKKNQNNRQVTKCCKTTEIHIDYDKLANAIVKAQKKVELVNYRAIKEKEKDEIKKWHESMHQKEYKDDKKIFLKEIHSLRNALVGIWFLFTLKKEKIRTDYITFNLLRLACSSIFALLSFILYIITLLILGYLIYDGLMTNVLKGMQPYCVFGAIGSLLFASLFRIASLETEKMDNRDKLTSLFSATTCFLAMIFAFIALLKG